jgi:hypothetical protein
VPYDNTNGYFQSTIAEIEQSYINKINEEFDANYTLETFKGSGFWRVFSASILKDKEIDNAIASLLVFVGEKIDSLADSFFKSQLGLVSGIQKALMSLEGIIKDVNIYNPVTLDEWRGKIAIAIEYESADLENNRNANDKIANAIINSIGAGIHTDSNNYDKSYLGVLESNSQVFTLFWKVAILTPVFLKFTYKQLAGTIIPTDEEIRAKLIENLSNYNFGNLFTPQYYVDLCSFPAFRDIKLEYSFDGKNFQSTEITPDFWVKYQFINDSTHIVIEDGEVNAK